MPATPLPRRWRAAPLERQGCRQVRGEPAMSSMHHYRDPASLAVLPDSRENPSLPHSSHAGLERIPLSTEASSARSATGAGPLAAIGENALRVSAPYGAVVSGSGRQTQATAPAIPQAIGSPAHFASHAIRSNVALTTETGCIVGPRTSLAMPHTPPTGTVPRHCADRQNRLPMRAPTMV